MTIVWRGLYRVLFSDDGRVQWNRHLRAKIDETQLKEDDKNLEKRNFSPVLTQSKIWSGQKDV